VRHNNFFVFLFDFYNFLGSFVSRFLLVSFRFLFFRSFSL